LSAVVSIVLMVRNSIMGAEMEGNSRDHPF